ncbi:venom peptide isomerase heavy chain-like isoform X2 [Uloborus diversus]|uniref:venom peptide isomerase heavy chain-like isoform X2 n=1 Tax=Uloborus diversus TaxID=327109 RepID=UPI00240A9287|nr:venom peptide isomerase heavy chain-like isoform X2 [Uloborus diversus]
MLLRPFAAVIFLLCAVTSDTGEVTPNIHDLLNVENCGKSLPQSQISDRIIGGDKVKHGKYPWMVAIYQRYEYYDENYLFRCGGAILNESWIVTSTYCIQRPKEPWNYWVYTGLYKLSEVDGPTVKRHKVSKIITHEEYNEYYIYKYNIALIKLKTPIDFAESGGYVNAICLPQNNEDPAGFATVTGWGNIGSRYNDRTDVLMEATVPIIPPAQCQNNYGNNICAGNKEKNFCDYDYGSPLLQRNYESVATLLGIVASGFSCGESDNPGQYTRVSMYLNWMAKKISEN